MSTKLAKRLSSKRKKLLKDLAKYELLITLGLEAFYPSQLDPASILDLSTWTLENQDPREPKDLPQSFLQRLWLLCPDARSPSCKAPSDVNGLSPCASVSPLDVVSAVFMCANPFLQQEMAARMIQCQFAVPLILPHMDAEQPSSFLLWPLRGVVKQWRTKDRVQEAVLASTFMPVITCVRLGSCAISKSEVLNHIIGSQTFLHRGTQEGEKPRRLSNGLVEIGWYLPTGDPTVDIFPVPVILSNLRGDASKHEKCLHLLCQASAAVVVLCKNPKEKEKQLLSSCKDVTKLILIDLSETEITEDRTVGFLDQNLQEELGLPDESVLSGSSLHAENLANVLCDAIERLLPDLRLTTLEAAAELAVEQGLQCDEETLCKKSMNRAEEVLKHLDMGPALFREKQLPLQGVSWSRLAQIGKEESKKNKGADPQLQKEKTDILTSLAGYKMTPSMKIFTDALLSADKVEKTYFLCWMRVKLRLLQVQQQMNLKDLLIKQQTEVNNDIPEESVLQNGASDTSDDSFCTDSTFEDEEVEQFIDTHLEVPKSKSGVSLKHILQTEKDEGSESLHLSSEQESVASEEILDNNISLRPVLRENGTFSVHGNDETSSTKQEINQSASMDCLEVTSTETIQPDPFFLGLEHFLREMGLIFELTHIHGHHVPRLPNVAADLLLNGIPLELMDGDASNVPMRWLSSVFAEVKRRLPREHFRTLTSLGVHHARNAEILSALFSVKFPSECKSSTRGVYLVVLRLPSELKKKLNCDCLMLIDVEGLCSTPPDPKNNCQIHDNEMATVATGLGHVLLQNIYSRAASEFEASLTVAVNALLRIRECGSMPICKVLVQDEGINTILEAAQLQRISDILQKEKDNAMTHNAKTETSTSYIKPWYNEPLPVDPHHSEAVLKVKRSLFGALKEAAPQSQTFGLPEFMSRLNCVWQAVKAESFSVSLQETEVALAFSIFCTELSEWEDNLMEHMECWIKSATKRISCTKPEALEPFSQTDLLCQLKDEAKEEIKVEVNKHQARVKTHLMGNKQLNAHVKMLKPILTISMNELQERLAKTMIQRLDRISENHCHYSQLNRIESILEDQQNAKLNVLLECSKSKNHLFEDVELEEEFEGMWNKVLSTFDFRLSEKEDIGKRVMIILKDNLIHRGLQKHLNKLSGVGQNQMTSFRVDDQYFGYRSRMKHMFEEKNNPQKGKAQELAENIIEKYKEFVAEKAGFLQHFSDSAITELLEIIDKALTETPLETRTAFEVDLKVFLCNAACKDFQKLHDRYAKDGELLRTINAKKSTLMAKFIYQFRKRDQSQRLAHRFLSDIITPTVMDYIYKPLGMQIVEEIQSSAPQYLSPQAFHKTLLEELVKEGQFESFMEYLSSYDAFRQRKVKETVAVHLLESNVNTRRLQRLGEIIGKIAAAVSQMAEGTSGVLSDTKPLLERVCFTLEADGDVCVPWACLNGPFYSITTEWDRFITCFMELLAGMRLELAQEFSHNVDSSQLLQCLPIQPSDLLFSKVKGCDALCPVCRTPCGVEQTGHQVHKSSLHRPKYLCPSTSLSHNSSPECLTPSDMDPQDVAASCWELHVVHPDWNISPEDTPSPYWRYVLATINERFAKEQKQQPAKIPDEWKKITQEEALDSLSQGSQT
ncbi:interferon-induced very large GTPase 1 [Dunckerocampus dactyliophorus]|uniref:interferon-induced very large GTPase 1 n=1 Tax=Dunckerocampus dactyliophorus TaxID=161453 RepID=UPI0024069710|nr:interferon-induced very large GTPase 1 [Dunckerocampus dactyliophorus]